MSPRQGELVTEVLPFDGGRPVTVYVPPVPAEAIVFSGDGQFVATLSAELEGAGAPSTMIVGVHGHADEALRLHEYSPGFDLDRFAAHKRFFVDEVRDWTRARFGVDLPADRTAVCGFSASGELALALGLRHPDVYSAILCASPGGGYQPSEALPSVLPRTYLLAGNEEPFFRANAARWAAALAAAGGEVVLAERAGAHGDPFWQEEFPTMVWWAFER